MWHLIKRQVYIESLRSEEAVEKKAMAINKVQDSKSGVGV
jgi:hypothetical protein